MAPKFNVLTADRDSLVDRVTQLTSALVKQKEVIAKQKVTEESLLAENEKLQRQIRNLGEEGEIARQLRGELQNEVARLQRLLDLATAELQMMRRASLSLTLPVPASRSDSSNAALSSTGCWATERTGAQGGGSPHGAARGNDDEHQEQQQQQRQQLDMEKDQGQQVGRLIRCSTRSAHMRAHQHNNRSSSSATKHARVRPCAHTHSQRSPRAKRGLD